MALLVPDNGGSVASAISGTGRGVGVIGPLPAGRWIDWIKVTVQCAASATLRIGLTLGASSEESDEAFRAGTTLIQRSANTLLGKPVFLLTFAAAGQEDFTLAVGRRVGSGPLFICVMVDVTSSGNTFWLASARVLGLARIVLRPGEEPAEVVLP